MLNKSGYSSDNFSLYSLTTTHVACSSFFFFGGGIIKWTHEQFLQNLKLNEFHEQKEMLKNSFRQISKEMLTERRQKS